MRLWSIHPAYLDARGLVALWREALLARKVLEGGTRGYNFHPQLIRFKTSKDPLASINTYLKFIHDESMSRGYNFNANKLSDSYTDSKMKVTRGQISFEFNHLMKKLKVRDRARYNEYRNIKQIKLHPLFVLVSGTVEKWEKTDLKFY